MTARERHTHLSTQPDACMLRIATTWQTLGQINQAIDVYFRILRDHPASSPAEEAKGRLLGLAATFEERGQYRLAMDLYERVEQACRP